jgi:hypothetical protein
VSAPVVTGIDPGSAPAGTLVVISGSGFTEDATAVHFGGVSVGPRFSVVDPTQVVARVPAGAGGVGVTVTTPGGTSAPVTFTYDPAPGPPGGGGGNAPIVASVAPSVAADSGGGDTVTVTGSGFTTTQAVRFGSGDGSPQGTFTIVSDAELSVVAPAGSGLVDVVVVTSYGESAATSADQFTYPALAPPTVGYITPTGGYVNDKVTIVGSGFAEGCAIHFGTESAAFDVESDTVITALAPDLTGVVHVTVSNAGGTSEETDGDLFTYGGDSLPHTSATNVESSGYSGWAQGAVTVTLTASVNNGYGIAHTFYQIDSGGIVEYAGPFTITGPGCHQVQFWSVDLRGNVEPTNVGWVNILSDSVVPAGLILTPLFDMVLAEWDLLVTPTPISYRLYVGEDAENVTTLALSTSANVASVAQPASAGPRYYAVSSVDVDGNESARSAVAGPVTAQAVVVPDGSLDITKFASSIKPPRVVSALPALPDPAWPAGSIAFLTTDGKLYRTLTGTAGTWVNMVNAADLTGAIDGSQIAAGSILGDALAGGIIDASLLDPAIKTVQSVDGLPDLPDAQYPPGTVVLESGEGKIYKAEDAADLVPIMTGANAPSGVASASTQNAGYEAWRAFDDTPGTYWLATAATGWLKYQFAIARVITRYRITPLVSSRASKTWTFEGSNDNATWDVLDTQTNVTSWADGTAKAFPVYANETSYTYYRLNVSAINGGTNLSLGQWELAGWTQQGAASAKVTLADLGDDVLAALTPLGAIIEWDETTQGAIPTGYHLCDGSTVNGRLLPDLRDKFVLARGTTYAPGATGGAATHPLSAAELAGHTHPIDHDHASVTSGGQSADHSHSGTTGTVSADHSHSGTTNGRSAQHNHRTNTQTIAKKDGTGTSNTVLQLAAAVNTTLTVEGEAQEHTHTFSTGGISANHTHAVTTGGVSVGHTHAVDLPAYTGASGSAGSGTPHNNMPPYYALAYIMRVS